VKKLILTNIVSVVFISFIFFLLFSYPGHNNGISREQKLKAQEEENHLLIVKGQYLFSKKCLKCHNMGVKIKGPALRDVTKKRKADWIKNLILYPYKMIVEDPIAKQLYLEHEIKMAVEDMKDEDADAVLEYLKSIDAKTGTNVN
jgi:cytochrome c551/c552